ncbi:MAG: diguanylate cyclase [Clostridiales bacterium]|nr:diguanylate cyclase [Clostridiales bacterium]
MDNGNGNPKKSLLFDVISKNGIKSSFIALILITLLLSSLYMTFSWRRHHRNLSMEAIKLAESVGALLSADDIAELSKREGNSENKVYSIMKAKLIRLVENTEPVHYAYLINHMDGNIHILVDSSINESTVFPPFEDPAEEKYKPLYMPFITGQSLLTEKIRNQCGTWFRALMPIKDSGGEEIIAILGLSYSAKEWGSIIWKRMIPSIIILVILLALFTILLILYAEHKLLKEKSEQLAFSERSKSVLLAHLPGMAYRCLYDPDWTMEFVSQGCLELTGYPPESLVGNQDIPYAHIVSPEYRDILWERWTKSLEQRRNFNYEYEIVTKSGERKWVLELGQGVYDKQGDLEALEGIILDISEQKMREAQITHLNESDFLTGLYNRSYMNQAKIHLDHPQYKPLSVVICDINGLRMVNDAYGYRKGDQMIIQTAKLIQGCCRRSDILGRVGGGEFILLMPQADDNEVHRIVHSITSAITAYNQRESDLPTDISLSIGYSTIESSEQSITEATKTAEEHLSRSKLLNQSSLHHSILSSIMATLYAKSQETEEHGQRLGYYATTIGEKMGLGQKDLDNLHILSMIHDVGKIGIDDSILNKPGKLTAEEWKQMKRHPEIGHRIAMSTPQLKHVAKYILHHHERWDGTGYPRALGGSEIPLLSRILAIADAYDAMTEDRVYRKALSKQDAIEEIKRNSGTQFDPKIASLFIQILEKEEAPKQIL